MNSTDHSTNTPRALGSCEEKDPDLRLVYKWILREMLRDRRLCRCGGDLHAILGRLEFMFPLEYRWDKENDPWIPREVNAAFNIWIGYRLGHWKVELNQLRIEARLKLVCKSIDACCSVPYGYILLICIQTDSTLILQNL